MNNIDYSWSDVETEDSENELLMPFIDDSQDHSKLSTRQDLQIARRLFHVANGSIFATIYLVSFSHQQMVHLLGTIACLLYVVEQLRINYPEIAGKLIPMTKFIIRAEEQLKESAMVPYVIAILLTIITFPKPIALVAIYTLAIADPLSAIIGIKYGKTRIVPHKSLEGSAAFFIATFFCTLIVLTIFSGFSAEVFAISTLIGVLSSIFEMLPIKIDDNLTIPLFTSFALWLICALFGIQV